MEVCGDTTFERQHFSAALYSARHLGASVGVIVCCLFVYVCMYVCVRVCVQGRPIRKVSVIETGVVSITHISFAQVRFCHLTASLSTSAVVETNTVLCTSTISCATTIHIAYSVRVCAACACLSDIYV